MNLIGRKNIFKITSNIVIAFFLIMYSKEIYGGETQFQIAQNNLENIIHSRILFLLKNFD
jgi:hypothetical protein